MARRRRELRCTIAEEPLQIAGSTVFVTLVEALLERGARRVYAGSRQLAALEPVVALDRVGPSSST